LRIDLDGAEGQHVQPVGGLEADAPHAVAKQHRADLRALVLEREVRVARAVDLEVADLALDPDGGKALLERHGQPPRQLGDGPDRTFAAAGGRSAHAISALSAAPPRPACSSTAWRR